MADLTTLGGLLTFAATAGVISAILNQIFGIGRDWWTARNTRQSQAGYMALRLAALLEGYSYACANFIGENANAYHGPEDQYPTFNVRLPELPPLPEEKEGWHSIDLKLAARTLDLRNHIAGSQGVIFASAEFTEDELEDDLGQHAGERGNEAWILAKDLRSRYGLSPFVPVWDFTETLESALKSAKRAKLERAERQHKMLQELASDDDRMGAPSPNST